MIVDDLDSDGHPGPIGGGCTPIRNPEARLWGHLFNLRYRMLLVDVSHAFTLSGALTRSGVLTARGAVINATFGEMYNLRSIANILVRTPLDGRGAAVAGPPFEMPYTLDLPEGEPNRWRLHRDLLEASATLVRKLERIGNKEHDGYLAALRAADEQAFRTVEAMLGQSRTEARAKRG